MAIIDLKNATIRLWDGTVPILTTTHASGVDGQVILTAIGKHHGSSTPSITLLDTGEDQSLSLAVVGKDVIVTMERAASALVTTAALLETAWNADPLCLALATIELAGTGAEILEAQAATRLTGHNSVEVTIGEGNLTYTEKKTREFKLNRGKLGSVRNADDEPMDVSFDFTWEFMTSANGASVPTVQEVLKRVAPADSWVTTADDPCQPYCVDLEIVNAPECSAIDDEGFLFEEFYYEQLDPDSKEGSVACSGRCNRLEASITRFDSTVMPL
jgi:hypothetical protein